MAMLSDECYPIPDERDAEQDSPLSINEAEIPDRVKASAKDAQIPLADAYADYLSQRNRERAIAKAAGELAVERTPGCPTGMWGERIYTVEEMKSMSHAQVRSHYGALMESLKKGIEKLY